MTDLKKDLLGDRDLFNDFEIRTKNPLGELKKKQRVQQKMREKRKIQQNPCNLK